jgi:hypothetical protein
MTFPNPSNFKISAHQVYCYLLIEQPQQASRNHRRTGATAAGLGFAYAALEYPQMDLSGIGDLHETGIDLLGEIRVLLNKRTQVLNGSGSHVINHGHRVGVAHGYGADTQ